MTNTFFSSKFKFWTLAGIIPVIVLGLLFLPRAADQLKAQYYSTNGTNNGTNTNVNNFGTGSGSFSLTSNNNYCVGQTPIYTIQGSGSWGGQNFQWTSMHDGQMTWQNTYTFDSGGGWSMAGNPWQSSDVGQWTKTANINGASQTLTFTVSNCGFGSVPTGGSNGNSNNGYIGNGTGNVGVGMTTSTAMPNGSSPQGIYYDSRGSICIPRSAWNGYNSF